MWLTSHLTQHLARRSRPGSLRNRLIAEERTRWVDVGSTSFGEGFFCVSSTPDARIPEQFRPFHRCIDVADEAAWIDIGWGTYDLVRMQHVFEHFGFEEAQTALAFCAQLLRPGGYLLITVPDLRIFALHYLTGFVFARRYREAMGRYRGLPEDAPPSAAFSIFAHQLGYSPVPHYGQAHKWCYDWAGLKHQVARSGAFRDIRRLHLLSPLAEVPFTHNRPVEDVCLLAVKA